jgi:hypothetical protein
MSSAEGTTDRRSAETVLEGLGAVLIDCAGALAPRCPAASGAWAAAGQALGEAFSCPPSDRSAAVVLLLDTADDRLTPPFLIVDGLIALIAEQVAAGEGPEHVIAVDRSLDGLRRLSGLLRRPGLPAAP